MLESCVECSWLFLVTFCKCSVWWPVCVKDFTRRGPPVHTKTLESSISRILFIDERFLFFLSILSVSHDGHHFKFYYIRSFDFHMLHMWHTLTHHVQQLWCRPLNNPFRSATPVISGLMIAFPVTAVSGRRLSQLYNQLIDPSVCLVPGFCCIV